MKNALKAKRQYAIYIIHNYFTQMYYIFSIFIARKRWFYKETIFKACFYFYFFSLNHPRSEVVPHLITPAPPKINFEK